jgi:hypothetical protein
MRRALARTLTHFLLARLLTRASSLSGDHLLHRSFSSSSPRRPLALRSFKHRLLGASTASPLSDAQLSPMIDALLPIGETASNYTVLGVEDVFNAQTEVEAEVQVHMYDYASGGGSSGDRRRALRGGRSLLSVSTDRSRGWTLTGYLANMSSALVSAAVDACDANACTQGISGVAGILNHHNATDAADAAARVALRGVMLGAAQFEACTAMMEHTTTAVTQRAAVLAKVS